METKQKNPKTKTKKKNPMDGLIREMKAKNQVLQKKIESLEVKLLKHINEPKATIMVKEKDGKWGEWTGTFYINDEEKTEVVVNKLEEHFSRNFSKGYDEKEFAMFLMRGNKKTLHKTINSKE